MKKSKMLKLDTSGQKLFSKKMLLSKSQLKGIKGGMIVEDAEGI